MASTPADRHDVPRPAWSRGVQSCTALHTFSHTHKPLERGWPDLELCWLTGHRDRGAPDHRAFGMAAPAERGSMPIADGRPSMARFDTRLCHYARWRHPPAGVDHPV